MRAFLVARKVFEDFGRHDGPLLAAAIAYYTLLSIFPLILGLIALLGLIVSDPSTRTEFIAAVASLFPGAEPLIQSTVFQVVEGRGTAGAIATIGLIWSASGVFGGISRALDIIWHVPQSRNVVVNSLLGVGLVFGVGIIFVVSLLLSAGLRVVHDSSLPWLGIPLGSIPLLFGLIGFVVPFAITFGIFAGIYKFVPNARLTWQQVWPGALLASVLFELSKQLFAWYLATFANYNAVYGSIGAVIALVTWAYYVAIVLLLGAEVNATISPPGPGRGRIPLAEKISSPDVARR